MNYLTIALAKGRLADETLKLLNRVDITCEIDESSRKLIFTNEEAKLRFFLSKAGDVTTYVEHGVADIGFAGKDTLMEEKRNVYEVVDLKLGKCRIVVAGYPEMKEKLFNTNNLRVATKYPNIVSDYFNRKNKTVDIIKLGGSVELGPVVGLSDVIVDLVETGSTLRENGLVILEEICQISARMIVNRVSMKIEYERITDIIRRLKAVIDNEDN